MLTVIPAKTIIDENNILHSVEFNDTYYSSAGGEEECQHVFINGNNILNRWHESDCFTIAELGFGTGVNFLTTAKAWISNQDKSNRLHFISIEKHPLPKEDLIELHSKLNLSSVLNEELIKYYPLPIAGTHRIHFEDQRIMLTLIFADAITALKEASFKANAWYLDGFAPSKNPELWSSEIASRVFQLTLQHGTFATYSVASEVIKNYSAAGFKVTKQKGFASKREMLVGIRKKQDDIATYSLNEKSWLISTASKTRCKKAIVIGGGLAGTMISAALVKRNWAITLIDRQSDLAMEGSGNKNAILMPRLSVDHDIQAQLTLLGFFYSIHYFHKLQKCCEDLIWHPCGAIQLPRDAQQQQRMQNIIAQEELPTKFLHEVTKEQASDLANSELSSGGWHFSMAGYTVPKTICTALTENNRDISLINNEEIFALEHKNNRWQVKNKHHIIVDEAEVVILANALDANRFTQTSWCTLHAKRGQITEIPVSNTSIHPRKIVCAEVYITPAINNYYILGATFVTDDIDTSVRKEEHEEILDKLKIIIPSASLPKLNSVSGRAAVRAVSPDRLPIVGPIADKQKFNLSYKHAALGATNTTYSIPNYLEGLYIATGFGSRGMAWIPLCAEILACTVNHEPSPVSQPLLNAIHPNRLLMKQLVKSVQ